MQTVAEIYRDAREEEARCKRQEEGSKRKEEREKPIVTFPSSTPISRSDPRFDSRWSRCLTIRKRKTRSFVETSAGETILTIGFAVSLTPKPQGMREGLTEGLEFRGKAIMVRMERRSDRTDKNSG
jgi:hypothetical protein